MHQQIVDRKYMYNNGRKRVIFAAILYLSAETRKPYALSLTRSSSSPQRVTGAAKTCLAVTINYFEEIQLYQRPGTLLNRTLAGCSRRQPSPAVGPLFRRMARSPASGEGSSPKAAGSGQPRWPAGGCEWRDGTADRRHTAAGGAAGVRGSRRPPLAGGT